MFYKLIFNILTKYLYCPIGIKNYNFKTYILKFFSGIIHTCDAEKYFKFINLVFDSYFGAFLLLT